MSGSCRPNIAKAAYVSGGSGPIAGAWSLRILVVEDEAIAALDLESYLLAIGHDVVGVVATGPDAITAAATHRPDVVFMDIRLSGGTSGIDAALEIRNRLGIPSVFLTAHTDAATYQQALAARPIDYLVKPYAHTQIDAVLKRVAGGRGGGRP
ncbi:MAG TPA: response regulator [Azospirillum sp.]|nr:response regulator [Azospirillum sp.]